MGQQRTYVGLYSDAISVGAHRFLSLLFIACYTNVIDRRETLRETYKKRAPDILWLDNYINFSTETIFNIVFPSHSAVNLQRKKLRSYNIDPVALRYLVIITL